MFKIQSHTSFIFSILIGLFFILVLHFKASYSVIPFLLCFAGLFFIVQISKQKKWHLSTGDKWIVGGFIFYFLAFVLSIIINGGKLRELDLASRALISLSIMMLLLHTHIKQKWIIYSILLSGIINGIVALIQVNVLKIRIPFPQVIQIQAGDIAMTLALFSLAISCYFIQKSNKIGIILSLFAFTCGLIGSLLTTVRGAWIALPTIVIILWLNRRILSKWIVIAMTFLVIIAGISAKDVIHKRYKAAEQDLILYTHANNGSTSVGARFDMWKSAWIGIQEKPIFGRSLEEMGEMRKQHAADGIISPAAGQFVNPHNQFLHDASARGIFGLSALLAVFFIPLILFYQNTKIAVTGSLSHLWGVLGITHVLSTMAYCLTQSFLSHNSGAMFYFVTVTILLTLQKQQNISD